MNAESTIMELAASLIESDPYPTSWNLAIADDDEGGNAYIDVSASSKPDTWVWEMSSGDNGASVAVYITGEELITMHRKLTAALMVRVQQREI